MPKKPWHEKVVRVGQTFALREALHGVRLFEAIAAGNMALVQRIASDPLGLSLRRKMMAMRDSGTVEMARRAEEARKADTIPAPPMPEGDGAA